MIMPDTLLNASQMLADQVQKHQADVLARNLPSVNGSGTCVKCLPEIVPCNVKLAIVFGWAVIIFLASYFTYEKKIPFMLFGRERSVGWVFSKLIILYPFIVLIIIGLFTLNVKPV